MPDKFVSKIVTPFGERKIKASAVTDELKEELKNTSLFLANYDTEAQQFLYPSFDDLDTARLAGKLPVIVEINPVGTRKYYIATSMVAYNNNARFKFVDAESGSMLKLEGPFSSPVWSKGSAYDSAISSDSANAVQNSAIFTAINGAKSIEFINFDTTFAQVGTILTAGKLPILVEETTPGSPNYYSLINNNGGTEYIFGNISGTLNRTYKLSGGGWTSDASISFENSLNKVTTWSGTPSDTNYPSEKLVYDTIGDVESLLAAL